MNGKMGRNEENAYLEIFSLYTQHYVKQKIWKFDIYYVAI